MYNLLKIKCINMLKSVAEIEDIMAYVYVVEDDKNISEIESFALKNAGHTVVECASGKEFHKLMRDRIPDMILLDVMLPDEDGLEILRKIRQTPETRRVPVIMVTAKTTELDKVKGLDLGADDYITKPFEIREVLARVQVQLRRKEEKETGIERDLSFKDMVLNRDTFQVRIDGRILSKITKQEFAILELLLRNPKQVFSKEDIFEYAWDEPYMGETKTLDVHISNIRKKIKQVTSDEYIETVWGIGYRLHA